MRSSIVALGVFSSLTLVAAAARADTIQVGPTRAKKTLQDIQALVKPGDIVEVDGDATYPGGVFFRAAQSGTTAQKVTIRGIKVNGKRPVISGGGTGVTTGLGMVLNGSHFVLESLEVTQSANTCIVHKGDDITIRDFVVHDCPGQGLLGNDNEAGSLTLEHSEFFNSGNDTFEHQIYMATSEDMYPGSVFRMQHCYVHDGKGGNNVKTRAQRNEIYYNWIEGAYYHNLEMIGPDQSPATAPREDSDVVGNVIVGGGSQKWHLVRIGGDKDEADTSGRYRFVNNTFVVGAGGAESIVRLMLRVDTLEMHNNAFVRAGAGTAPMFAVSEVQWVSGVSIFGSNNWIHGGITGAPASFTGTLTGADPGVTDLATLDLRPKEGSPLLDAAKADPTSVAGRAFPSPLATPTFVPPARQLSATPAPRGASGALDIGAFELGSGAPPSPGGTPPGTGGTSSSGGGSSGGTDGGANAASAGSPGATDDSGCGCGVVGRYGLDPCKLGIAAAGTGLVVAIRRRRRAKRSA